MPMLDANKLLDSSSAVSSKKHDQRELTAAEQRRLEAFDVMSNDFLAQGYTLTPLTASIVGANVFAVAFGVPFFLGFGALFFALNDGSWADDLGFSTALAGIAIFVVFVVVHELIHGLTWAVFAKNHFRDIEFGYIKEYATPYCTCKTPLARGSYILGAAMPCMVLGIIPSIVGVSTGSFLWLAIGLMMTMAAGGDALVIAKVLRHRTRAKEVLYCDHPTEIGGVVFER